MKTRGGVGGGRGGGGGYNDCHHHGTNPNRGGGVNRVGRRKRLVIEGERTKRTHPKRGGGQFYDNIES